MSIVYHQNSLTVLCWERPENDELLLRIRGERDYPFHLFSTDPEHGPQYWRASSCCRLWETCSRRFEIGNLPQGQLSLYGVRQGDGGAFEVTDVSFRCRHQFYLPLVLRFLPSSVPTPSNTRPPHKTPTSTATKTVIPTHEITVTATKTVIPTHEVAASP